MDGRMELDPDFNEFIASCAAHDVRFLIVGGYAVAAHGHPRFTKDLDVWVWLEAQNANRLVAALEDFGFGSLGLTPDDFLDEGTVIQLGYPPKRIDILTQVDGVHFESCWERRIEVEREGVRPPPGSRRRRCNRGTVEQLLSRGAAYERPKLSPRVLRRHTAEFKYAAISSPQRNRRSTA
jgi:hypothetical protein